MKVTQSLSFLAAAGASFAFIASLSAGAWNGSHRARAEVRAEPSPGVLGLLSDSVPSALAQVSGTRLKPKSIRGTDGSKLYDPKVLYDTDLQIDCSFALAADGKLRCLPSGPAYQTLIRYKDSNCTQPVVGYERPTPPIGCPFGAVPKHVLVADESSDCPRADGRSALHVYPVLTQSNAPGQYVLLKGVCAGNSGVAGEPYDIGAEIPPSTFVEGTAGTDP